VEWLTRLLERIFSVIPRILVVKPDELGARCTPKIWNGIKINELVPGWYIWLPLIQRVERVKCKTQIVDLRSQSVWTSDRQEMTISGAIRYRVHSALKTLWEVYDYDQNIQTAALGIIQQYIREHELQDLDTQRIEAKVLKGVRKASEGWGLRVERVYITDIGRTQNIRILLNEPILGD